MAWVSGPVLNSLDVRSLRAATGSIAGGATVEQTHSWPTPFADTNYVVSCEVEEPTAGTSTLRIRRIVSRTASGVTVRLENSDTLNARSGTLHLIGVHD